jgi:hypothetical protein
MNGLLAMFSPASPAWMRDALCIEYVDHRDDWWFGDDKAPAHAAKSICRQCPVREECLDYALADATLCGVWGGLTKPERTGARKARLSAANVIALEAGEFTAVA